MELQLTRTVIDGLITYITEHAGHRMKLRTPTLTSDRGPQITCRVMLSHPEHSRWENDVRSRLIVVKPVSSKHHRLYTHDGWYRDEHNRLVAAFHIDGKKVVLNAGVHTRHTRFSLNCKKPSQAWVATRSDGTLYVAGLSSLEDFYLPREFAL